MTSIYKTKVNTWKMAQEKEAKKKKKYRLGLELQGDYKGKSIAGKAKELVVTGVKQTVGTATDLKKWITNKKKKKDYANQ
jgi:hypothetical protein